MGFHFAHKFVSRMASNTSQLSGISGFSDDQDVDDFEQGNLLRGIGNKTIRKWIENFNLFIHICSFISSKLKLDIMAYLDPASNHGSKPTKVQC